jgi:amino acid transporter
MGVKTTNRTRRLWAISLKIMATTVGLIGIAYGLLYLAQELAYLSSGPTFTVEDTISIMASFALIISGVVLAISLPESLRVKFRRPLQRGRVNPIYGFSTTLAVGIGATLGSPLFILIPENVLQYEIVSIGALLAATVLSVLMAKVYADMYVLSKRNNLGAVGGPSFTKVACGTRSVRYFISRASMWIANTALAAYSKIVFVIFDVDFLPKILSGFGVSGFESMLIVYSIAVVFVGWSVSNAIFELRLLKAIGYLQIVSTAVMIAILVYQSYALGSAGSWNMSGLFNLSFKGNWATSLIIDTGYLYLLFFGFQEIQSLERDTVEQSSIPVVSWIKKGYKMEKTTYLGVAMISSVVIAAAINIFYALAVYSAHPNLVAVNTSQIPALYLAKLFLGTKQELLMAIAFLIATFTTFVPAFLAASRHLAALSEDGFVPRSLSTYGWLFTFMAILFLALGPQNFLVNVTDIMVLISLGFITLSAIWISKKGMGWLQRQNLLPVGVGLSCFVAAGAIYFIDARVAVFGAVTIILMYLIFDVFELGALGVQLFLSLFDAACFSIYLSLPYKPYPGYRLNLLLIHPFYQLAGTTLALGLIISSALLFTNFLTDVLVLKRHRPLRSESRTIKQSRV